MRTACLAKQVLHGLQRTVSRSSSGIGGTDCLSYKVHLLPKLLMLMYGSGYGLLSTLPICPPELPQILDAAPQTCPCLSQAAGAWLKGMTMWHVGNLLQACTR